MHYIVVTYLIFLRNCQTVSLSGCTVLHSPQQYMSDPVSLHPGQHLVLLLFFILAILIGVWRILIVIFIFISLMANEVEHVFVCLIPSV